MNVRIETIDFINSVYEKNVKQSQLGCLIFCYDSQNIKKIKRKITKKICNLAQTFFSDQNIVEHFVHSTQ